MPLPAAEGTVCEQVCADVHGCISGGDLETAARLELRCLDACVRSPDPFTGCARPSTITSDRCGPFLACLDRDWPDHKPRDPVVEPTPDGCKLACGALAECMGQPVEAAQHCERLCHEALVSEDDRQAAARCTKLDGCPNIVDCVTSLPGA